MQGHEYRGKAMEAMEKQSMLGNIDDSVKGNEVMPKGTAFSS